MLRSIPCNLGLFRFPVLSSPSQQVNKSGLHSLLIYVHVQPTNCFEANRSQHSAPPLSGPPPVRFYERPLHLPLFVKARYVRPTTSTPTRRNFPEFPTEPANLPTDLRSRCCEKFPSAGLNRPIPLSPPPFIPLPTGQYFCRFLANR